MDPGDGRSSPWKGRGKFAYETGSAMNSLRWEGKLVDVMVICGPRTLPAHRLVLASSSPFFENLLVEDSKKSPSTTLDLEDVDADTMETLLDYMYKGQARPTNVDTDHMINLMTTAHLLQIYVGGRYFCESLLHMRPCRNLSLLWDWAEEFDSLEVEQTLIDYIVKNMNMVWKYRDFGALSLDRIVTILSQPVLSSSENQDDVLSAVVAWLKHDLDERKGKLSLLTPHINFQRLSDDFVCRLIQEEPVMQSCLQLVKRFATAQIHVGKQKKLPLATVGSESALAVKPKSVDRTPKVCASSCGPNPSGLHSGSGTQGSRTDMGKPMLPSGCNKRPSSRSTSHKLAVKEIAPANCSLPYSPLRSHQLLIAGRDDANRFVIQVYSFQRRMWSEREEICIPATNQESLIYCSGSVYIMGGEDQRGCKLRDVVAYTPQTKEMRVLAPMRVARSSAGLALNGFQIYVVGGVSRFGKPMTHVECYNTARNTWQILPTVKEKRSDPGLVILNERIYLIGGDTRRCEYFDPTNEAWHTAAPLPEQLRQLSVFVAAEGDKLFVFRGHRPDRTYSYDPALNMWHTIKTYGPPPESIRALASCEGEIWALDKGNRVIMFNTGTNCWELSVPLPHGFSKPNHLAIIPEDAFKKREE